jgi:hypothetical protein
MAVMSFAVGVLAAACGTDRALIVDRGNCGGGGGGGAAAGTPGADGQDTSPALADLQGIYAIDDVTRNPSGCASCGPSVKATETALWFFAKVIVPAAGVEQLALAGCTDVASCESKAGITRDPSLTGGPWGYSVSGVGPASGGDTLFVLPAAAGMCAGEFIEHATLTSVAAGMLRIEVRTVAVPTYPARGGTTCDLADARAAAAGRPCLSLKVITGTYEQAFLPERS